MQFLSKLLEGVYHQQEKEEEEVNIGETLEDYLDNKVFASAESSTVMAEPELVSSYEKYLSAYVRAFPVERKAVELF